MNNFIGICSLNKEQTTPNIYVRAEDISSIQVDTDGDWMIMFKEKQTIVLADDGSRCHLTSIQAFNHEAVIHTLSK